MENKENINVNCNRIQTDYITYTKNIGKRDRQEDSLVFTSAKNKPGYIIGVSDGMGGEQCGNKASQIVERSFESWYRKEKNYILNDKKEILIALKQVVEETKQIINRDLPGRAGATLSCAVVNKINNFVTIVNVGDSRGYAFDKDKGLHILTNDHTYNFEDYFKNKEKTNENLDNYRYHTTNEIYSCFGGGLYDMTIEYITLNNIPDKLLFATDGFTDVVPTSMMENYMKYFNNDCSIVGRYCSLAVNNHDDFFSINDGRIKNHGDNVSIIMSSKDKARMRKFKD